MDFSPDLGGLSASSVSLLNPKSVKSGSVKLRVDSIRFLYFITQKLGVSPKILTDYVTDATATYRTFFYTNGL